ncbi:hypothetical protein H6M51_12405 [Rhizobium sp. AQ_MP]|uniref:hypothetical protein n=1 Tax=Rhizobium sp. AQ_MP TaxID=2761536 RepID=UPI0016399ED5|nr:hypothetical protein [Rhizobium sp. AQ_MP]MBC2773668.1 hypothetical protein [Rhizobium sp. AQ_MP]
MAISAEELTKVTYLDARSLGDRVLTLVPYWDGSAWHLWLEAPPGSLIKMQPLDAVHSKYVAKVAAQSSDIWVGFIEFIWQRANWPEVSQIMNSIEDDFHLLATSAAKLRHFFHSRNEIDNAILGSFVSSELEYMITVSRSVFDLLQEALAAIWNNRIKLIDPEQEAVKKQHKLPDSFTKMALDGRTKLKSFEDMVSKYAIPPVLAEQYLNFSPFYMSLLRSRDSIIHGGGSVKSIYVTEKGFCVDCRSKTFRDFEWMPEHHYNESLTSLLPWVAHLVFGTVNACNSIVSAFASVMSMPPEVAPGYNLFIRDPAGTELRCLADVANGGAIWWTEAISDPSSCE